MKSGDDNQPEWNVEGWDDTCWLPADTPFSPRATAGLLDELLANDEGFSSDASSASLHSSFVTSEVQHCPPELPVTLTQLPPVPSPVSLEAIMSILRQPKHPGLPMLLPAGGFVADSSSTQQLYRQQQYLKRDHDTSDSDASTDDASKRLKPTATRTEKNRISAANSRAKQKQTLHSLNEKIAQQQEELNENYAEIARLQAQNASLLDQVDFFRSLVQGSYRQTCSPVTVPPVSSLTGDHVRRGESPSSACAPATPRSAARTPPGRTVGSLGAVTLAIAFVCAFVSLPGMGPVLLNGGSGGGGEAVGAVGGVGGRGLLSDGPAVTQAVHTDAPTPGFLWSPSAAIALGIHVLGLQDLAQTVLSHAVAICMMLGLLFVLHRSGVAPWLWPASSFGLRTSVGRGSVDLPVASR